MAEMEEILRQGLAELGLEADSLALERLRRYYVLLEEKNRVMNLTAIRGEADTARLHFLDCAALLKFLPLAGKRVADIGSGAGFPGLVLKILRPDVELVTVDSLQKRVAFQREVVTALDLDGIEPTVGRAEELSQWRESFDVVTCRAVAAMDLLSELCLPLVKPGGVFAAMKGPAPEAETDGAARAIELLGGGEPRLERYTVPGTDAVHSLVIVGKIAPTPKKYPRKFSAMKKAPL